MPTRRELTIYASGMQQFLKLQIKVVASPSQPLLPFYSPDTSVTKPTQDIP